MLSRNDIKSLARLQQKKYRLAEQKFIIEGLRLVIEALRSDWPIELLLMTHAFSERPPAPIIIAKARQKQIPVYQVPKMEFKKITDTVHSQGVVGILRMKQWQDTPIALFHKLPRCLFIAIEKLQDPGNLGTIIRTAEWLGADAAVLGPECVEWSNPKALRASMGAIFFLPVFQEAAFTEFLRQARQQSAMIYAADPQGEFPYTTLRYGPKKILLLGEETRGISEACSELANYKVSIPRRGKGDSLNVSIAAAILLAEMTR